MTRQDAHLENVPLDMLIHAVELVKFALFRHDPAALRHVVHCHIHTCGAMEVPCCRTTFEDRVEHLRFSVEAILAE